MCDLVVKQLRPGVSLDEAFAVGFVSFQQTLLFDLIESLALLSSLGVEGPCFLEHVQKGSDVRRGGERAMSGNDLDLGWHDLEDGFEPCDHAADAPTVSRID